jgi:uncharacterized protein YuzE
MKITWDREANAAYISLIDDQERVVGVAKHSIPLDELDGAAEIASLRSLVLDFDADGRLIGIEVLAPDSVLRSSTLRAATTR